MFVGFVCAASYFTGVDFAPQHHRSGAIGSAVTIPRGLVSAFAYIVSVLLLTACPLSAGMRLRTAGGARISDPLT